MKIIALLSQHRIDLSLQACVPKLWKSVTFSYAAMEIRLFASPSHQDHLWHRFFYAPQMESYPCSSGIAKFEDPYLSAPPLILQLHLLMPYAHREESAYTQSPIQNQSVVLLLPCQINCET